MKNHRDEKYMTQTASWMKSKSEKYTSENNKKWICTNEQYTNEKYTSQKYENESKQIKSIQIKSIWIKTKSIRINNMRMKKSIRMKKGMKKGYKLKLKLCELRIYEWKKVSE